MNEAKVRVEVDVEDSEEEPLPMIGRFDLAMHVLRDRWGERFIERGYDTCLEEWTHNGSWRSGAWAGFLRTHSHAWSAHPAAFLTARLAGLDIREPGCTTIAVRPADLGVDYTLRVPLPQGVLRVERRGDAVAIDPPPGVAVV